jgi:formyltetrahydrofolate deformylase
MNNHILLVDCPDREGLVYRVTGVLYRNSCNIISNGEFVDRDSKHFFMRTEFSGDIDRSAILAELKKDLGDDAAIKLAEKKKKNIVILASKEHHCPGDLILRQKYGELKADIRAVISNHDVLRDLADKFDIPFHHIPHDNLNRDEHETMVMGAIDDHSPDYIVLAKYMRILTGRFVSAYANRMINIHHSFLPAFIGANPYQRAYDRGVKIIGATAHFVTENLDEGPIIAQDVITISHTHGVEDMIQAGRDVEKVVLARALRLALEDRIFVNRNKTIIFD